MKIIKGIIYKYTTGRFWSEAINSQDLCVFELSLTVGIEYQNYTHSVGENDAIITVKNGFLTGVCSK